MAMTISSADLRQLSGSDRARILDAAFAAAPGALANYLAVLDARLCVFEQRYELPSAALFDALADGRLRDTADVSEWSFLVSLRDDFAGQARP